MSLNPFEAVENYPTMLNKIAWYNFFGGVLIVLFLNARIPDIEKYLSYVGGKPQIFGMEFSLLILLIPLLIAIISRIIKLHDKISDLFGIRKNYDVKYILTPLFEKAGITVTDSVLIIIKKYRIQLMKNYFYKYASSTKEKCQIDFHNVTMALDQFAWFWILVEFIFLLFIGMIVSFVLSDNFGFSILGLTVLSAVILAFGVLKSCRHYSLIEVNSILDLPNKKDEIALSFNLFISEIQSKG